MKVFHRAKLSLEIIFSPIFANCGKFQHVLTSQAQMAIAFDRSDILSICTVLFDMSIDTRRLINRITVSTFTLDKSGRTPDSGTRLSTKHWLSVINSLRTSGCLTFTLSMKRRAVFTISQYQTAFCKSHPMGKFYTVKGKTAKGWRVGGDFHLCNVDIDWVTKRGLKHNLLCYYILICTVYCYYQTLIYYRQKTRSYYRTRKIPWLLFWMDHYSKSFSIDLVLVLMSFAKV